MGKILALVIVGCALLAGAGVYYTQVYAYYDVLPDNSVQIRLTPVAGGAPETIIARDVRAIDADSSPLRFRACFTTPMSLALLTETYDIIDAAEPRVGPGWFDCYDAASIGAALESGEAIGFLAQRDIHEGFDRVVAIFPDGRGFAWHQPNEKSED